MRNGARFVPTSGVARVVHWRELNPTEARNMHRSVQSLPSSGKAAFAALAAGVAAAIAAIHAAHSSPRAGTVASNSPTGGMRAAASAAVLARTVPAENTEGSIGPARREPPTNSPAAQTVASHGSEGGTEPGCESRWRELDQGPAGHRVLETCPGEFLTHAPSSGRARAKSPDRIRLPGVELRHRERLSPAIGAPRALTIGAPRLDG
jgi:hypothetical protein